MVNPQVGGQFGLKPSCNFVAAEFVGIPRRFSVFTPDFRLCDQKIASLPRMATRPYNTFVQSTGGELLNKEKQMGFA